MQRFLGRYSEAAYVALRFVAGSLFACHGAQKLFGVLGGTRQLSDPIVLAAGIIEFFGGVMIGVGLWAGIAAFVASGEMAVAYFKAHAPGGFWPILNHGELSALYCFVFFYIATQGSRAFSVDSLATRNRSVSTSAAPRG